MASTEQRIADLEARLAKVEASPKVAPYISGAQWPRAMSMADGTTSSGEVDKLKFDRAHPKSKQLTAAEEAEATAQADFKTAQAAWVEASRPERGGTYLLDDVYGNKIVQEVAATEVWSLDKTLPEFAAADMGERRLIQARVRVFKLQRERELEYKAWQEELNPSPNPSTYEKPATWSRRIRMAAIGGKR
ncbi:MAG TPA: hypothetical protein VGU71_04175 [Candidatus Dormibacteraeota bacterium]|nr:hypothetical protein [Candidatus Dormibacteraeota bacterium]